ncbi:uncharacterized protein [Drosophila tropicalis]|uniref:uncharacterized protein n=1 Tax=Drosophila tropicalis TaxID=46794 RepID=UPI0035ABE7F7
MPPTLYLVLLWRMAIHMLYPFIYMNTTLQDALGADYAKMWIKTNRLYNPDMELKDSVKSCLLLAMIMEIIEHSIRFL